MQLMARDLVIQTPKNKIGTHILLDKKIQIHFNVCYIIFEVTFFIEFLDHRLMHIHYIL